MLLNYLVTRNQVVTLTAPSKPDFYVEDVAIKLLASDTKKREEFLQKLGVESIILQRIGVDVASSNKTLFVRFDDNADEKLNSLRLNNIRG